MATLTPQQQAALKAFILADEALNAFPNNSDGNFHLAAVLNVEAAPAWKVWRTAVTRREILQNGFDWTRLDNLTVGKARVWTDIFVDGVINPSMINVRAGIDSVWVGTAADLAVRTAVYVHCKRNATIVQKLFSTGTGSVGDPATLAANIDESYRVTPQELETARNLP